MRSSIASPTFSTEKIEVPSWQAPREQSQSTRTASTSLYKQCKYINANYNTLQVKLNEVRSAVMANPQEMGKMSGSSGVFVLRNAENGKKKAQAENLMKTYSSIMLDAVRNRKTSFHPAVVSAMRSTVIFEEICRLDCTIWTKFEDNNRLLEGVYVCVKTEKNRKVLNPVKRPLASCLRRKYLSVKVRLANLNNFEMFEYDDNEKLIESSSFSSSATATFYEPLCSNSRTTPTAVKDSVVKIAQATYGTPSPGKASYARKLPTVRGDHVSNDDNGSFPMHSSVCKLNASLNMAREPAGDRLFN